ncbi:IS110 family transposase [Amphritea opalescens]|uniref:IS110 family transposase n=1 Tax=Amphritea opalescens TaxID=2490544 RepID=A0A430KV63_9GAMM|nr:IS110 family transposase [Amphritea opalescens]
MTHKTDKSDAAMLSYYGEEQPQDIRLWQPEAPEVRELKSLMRRLSALEKDKQREHNRLESCEISDTSDRVRQSLHEMITVIEVEIEKLKQNIDEHIDRHPPLKKNRQLLESIKGIGEVMSRELTYLFAAKRFKTAKQVAAYMGLIPKLKESGKIKGYTALSKTGPSHLRAKLYMAAVTAKQHNPDIRRQYERLLAAGKAKMSALGAAMRKLVQVCFGVVKNQSEFQVQTA